MLRAARSLQRVVATSGSHGSPQLLRRPTTLLSLRSPPLQITRTLLHSSASVRDDEAGEGGGEGAGGGSGAGGRRSLRQRIKETPVDPRLYQHLERLGLGADSRRRPPKGQRRRKQRVNVDMDRIEARLHKEAIPYFQANRFTQAKRALRRERRRLVKEASNRLHLLNRGQVERQEAALKRRQRQREEERARGVGQKSEQQQRQRATAEEAEEDRARRLSKLFRASAASGPVRFASAASKFEDLPAPLLVQQQGQEEDGRRVKERRGGIVPEVALAGRSNVGKSTLLNALIGLHARRGAAAVGDKPGVTQRLDFYRIGSRSNPRLVVVDLPGYGFAFGKEERVGQCQQLALAYLRHRGAPLKRLLLLLDARHGLKHQDRVFLQQLYAPPSNEEEEEGVPSVVWDSEAVLGADKDGEARGEEEEGSLFEDEEEEEEHHDDDDDDDEEIEEDATTALLPSPIAASPLLPPFNPPKLQVIFTKCDLLPRDELAKRVLLVRRELEQDLRVQQLDIPSRSAAAGMAGSLPSLMVAAAQGRKGLAELQAELAALLPHPPQQRRAAAPLSTQPAVPRSPAAVAAGSTGVRGGKGGRGKEMGQHGRQGVRRQGRQQR